MRVFSKNLLISSSLFVGLLLLAACGRSRVDESQLPTPIPSLSVEQLAAPVNAEPTATTAPTLAATDTPVQEATAEPTATEVISETATVQNSEEQPASPIATPTLEATVESVITSSATLSETATPEATLQTTPTVTVEVTPTVSVELTATTAVTATTIETEPITGTATLVTTATVPITEVQPITVEGTLTTSEAITPMVGVLPAGLHEMIASGDPANGQLLTQKNACIGCHSLDKDVKLVGPSWYGLADRAGTRVPGETAEEYLYTSITQPNAYVVEGFQPGLMLQTYAQTLSEKDLGDIISFLLTLKAK